MSTPPTALIETYFTCTQLPVVSFYNALGISTGIIQLLLTVCVILLLPLLVLHVHREQKRQLLEEGFALGKAVDDVVKEDTGQGGLQQNDSGRGNDGRGSDDVDFGVQLSSPLDYHTPQSFSSPSSRQDAVRKQHIQQQQGLQQQQEGKEMFFDEWRQQQHRNTDNDIDTQNTLATVTAAPTLEDTLATLVRELHATRLFINEGNVPNPDDPLTPLALKLFQGR